MADTDMEDMVMAMGMDTPEVMATTTARGPPMLSQKLHPTLGTDMEGMEDTAVDMEDTVATVMDTAGAMDTATTNKRDSTWQICHQWIRIPTTALLYTFCCQISRVQFMKWKLIFQSLTINTTFL